MPSISPPPHCVMFITQNYINSNLSIVRISAAMPWMARLPVRPIRGGLGRRKLAAAGGVLFLLVVGHTAGAEEKPAGSAAELPARVETRHTVTLAGRPLDYRAVAETIGLTDQKGNTVASVYTVSYLA